MRNEVQMRAHNTLGQGLFRWLFAVFSQKVSEGFFEESIQTYTFLCGQDPDGSQKLAIDSGVYIGLFVGALLHSDTRSVIKP